MALATLGVTAMVLIFGEVLPKTFAITNPDRWPRAWHRWILVLIRLFSRPSVSVVRALVRGILSLFG